MGCRETSEVRPRKDEKRKRDSAAVEKKGGPENDFYESRTEISAAKRVRYLLI